MVGPGVVVDGGRTKTPCPLSQIFDVRRLVRPSTDEKVVPVGEAGARRYGNQRVRTAVVCVPAVEVLNRA